MLWLYLGNSQVSVYRTIGPTLVLNCFSSKHLCTWPSVTPYAVILPSVTPCAVTLPSVTPCAATLPSVTPCAVTLPSVTPCAVTLPSVTPCAATLPFSESASALHSGLRQKTCLRGLQPGPTQTKLCSHIRWLEA